MVKPFPNRRCRGNDGVDPTVGQSHESTRCQPGQRPRHPTQVRLRVDLADEVLVSVVDDLAVVTTSPQQRQRDELGIVDVQHLGLKGLQVMPRLPLTDDQPTDSPLLPMQCDDRDALVNPVTLGGDDEMIVMTGPDQRPRLLVEDPVVVAVMHRRQGHHPAEARGIGHQSLLPASSSTLATLAAALPSP